jgi:selenoprotein W-related protein
VAAEIGAAIGATPELIEGGSGVFEVVRDGALIYSKKETGRFPNPGELTELLQD